MSETIEETVLLGSKNVIRVVVTDDAGVVIPFETNGVQEMIVYVSGLELSSITHPNDIKWDNIGGINLMLGGHAIKPKLWHDVSIKSFDPENPNDDAAAEGINLVHPNSDYARMKIVAYDSTMGYMPS